MSRQKGSANLAASLEVLAGAPLDARSKVPLKTDLTTASNFPYPYEGMQVYVVEEKKTYTLIGNDVTVLANWQEDGSGGGSSVTVDDAMSDSSTNPVQNKVITEALASKADLNSSGKVPTTQIPTYSFNNLSSRPTKSVTSIDSIMTPLPGVTPRMMEYSTDEQIIGHWIDGKPIYQKTFVTTTPNCTTNGTQVTKELSMGASIDKLIRIDGYITGSTSAPARHIPAYVFASSKLLSLVCIVYTNSYTTTSKRNILLMSNTHTDYSNLDCQITVQYTKTTD